MYLNIFQTCRKIYKDTKVSQIQAFSSWNANQKFSQILKARETSANVYFIEIFVLCNFSADCVNKILKSCKNPSKQMLHWEEECLDSISRARPDLR